MPRFATVSSEFGPWQLSVRYPEGFANHVEPFTFAIISDPHCDQTPSSIRHSQGLEHLGSGVDRLRLCFDAIVRLKGPDRPAFILLLGDIGLDAAPPLLASAPCPIHPVAGNHDWGDRRDRLRAMFPHDFGRAGQISDYYQFQHNGVTFIAICNAGIGNEHTGQLCSEAILPPGQPGWIREQLEETSDPKVLFGHAPPQPPGLDIGAYHARASHSYLPFMGECDSDFLTRSLGGSTLTAAFFGHLHRATTSYSVGRARIHVLRSCTWNHDKEPIGFMQVKIGPAGLSVREAITGKYA